MRITFDPAKRERTLEERDLDFADADQVFAGTTFDRVDDRRDYGEERIITIGRMAARMVVVVWTQRDDARHVISMRKTNDREQDRYEAYLD
ncbi:MULTISPECIES: BrnT family toxin [unclassified Aurantimonas]|uniref:BrnT family toxin n=1 Tax=unclassified Aurantimonas TaxID=2638230 RepID=UPI002E19FAC4|nr:MULTISPECIES: BrnT family toxin [unclassified Aurantimonas]MEC5293806.1 BrnT family toxin [Aurantimonas sp. C2-3-R2]MEC5414869.1 BrnT family toxin [Aurantimonas sp. C2-4-R8]